MLARLGVTTSNVRGHADKIRLTDCCKDRWLIMTLENFLKRNRDKIIELCWEKTKTLAGDRKTSDLLQKGLPLFYDQLIVVLEQKLHSGSKEAMLGSAASHGKELLRLGYSLSHVVHAYGAMCQAITECATQSDAKITPGEFNILNGCLDVAIASAVSEYEFQSNEVIEARERQHLGFLAHELRNTLSSATIAQNMIRKGLVGTAGSTANVLEANLARMRNLIDRSLSEVRMRADADFYVEKFRLFDLFDQIIITAKIDAEKKNQTVVFDVDPKIEIEADRQFILSAIANLVQNAIKYSKQAGMIILRGEQEGDKVNIEIEDECGGLDPSKIDSLFEPYVQASEDRSGLGLGLSIVQRAIHLSQETITIRNLPGKSCVFVIQIPKALKSISSAKSAVHGKDSVQPDLRRN
jgi:signal transduction histidine kinase